MSDFFLAVLFAIVLHREFRIWNHRRQATKRIKDYIEREHAKHPVPVTVKKVKRNAKTV
jgi:hypothetical protein